MTQERDILFAMPDNPVPPASHAGYLETTDGYRLRYATFKATGRPLRGTVIILHGRNECIEKYFETINELSEAGFGAATFDWRGQGGSDRLLKDRARGYVDDFATYVADLEQFMTDVVLPDCRGPYYILGHSTGSLIALLASPNMTNRIRRMVLGSPLLAIRQKMMSARSVALIARMLDLVGLGRIYMAGGPRPREIAPFATNKLTTDHRRYMRNARLYEEHPELALGGPTVAWVNAACMAMEEVTDPEFIAGIRVPALMISAGNDSIVSNEAIEHYARAMRSGALLTIDGARHELLQEADGYRSPFMAAALAYFSGEQG